MRLSVVLSTCSTLSATAVADAFCFRDVFAEVDWHLTTPAGGTPSGSAATGESASGRIWADFENSASLSGADDCCCADIAAEVNSSDAQTQLDFNDIKLALGPLRSQVVPAPDSSDRNRLRAGSFVDNSVGIGAREWVSGSGFEFEYTAHESLVAEIEISIVVVERDCENFCIMTAALCDVETACDFPSPAACECDNISQDVVIVYRSSGLFRSASYINGMFSGFTSVNQSSQATGGPAAGCTDTTTTATRTIQGSYDIDDTIKFEAYVVPLELCLLDLDTDGDIDCDDVTELSNAVNSTPNPITNLRLDFEGDGDIDADDLEVFEAAVEALLGSACP